MTRRSSCLASVQPLLLALACTSKPTAAPVPDALRGAYGRTETDAFLPTLGLEVDVDTLRFSELTLKIIEGKVTSTDNYQVSVAELSWAQDDKPPTKCKGTIARQGTRLLLSLFQIVGDKPCDTALKGEWKAWHATTTIPEALRGNFGGLDVYASVEAIKIGEQAIDFTVLGEPLAIQEAVVYEGREDQVIIRKSSHGEISCRGSFRVKQDGELGGRFDPTPASKAIDKRAKCPILWGRRWITNTKGLPERVSNGKVRLEIHGDSVRLATTDEQNLVCEQSIIRTATRNVADSGRDGVPVMGGKVLVLAPATPKSGAQACKDRLGGLVSAQCEEMLGGPCPSSWLRADPAQLKAKCPSHIIIGDPEAAGRKIALLPGNVQSAVCWEMRDRFRQ